MNTKIQSLQSEREGNLAKIAKLQNRNKEIDAKIIELENTSIIGLVREYSLTPDMLAELLNAMKSGKLPFAVKEGINEN